MSNSKKNMRAGEILIARLAKETTLVRYLSHTESRVTIALNRNKQARIPHNRVLLNTELVSTGDQDFERLRDHCLALSSNIDLAKLWEAAMEGSTFSVDNLSKLYWGISPEPVHRAAMLMRLEQPSDFFDREINGYKPRPLKSIEESRTERIRMAELAAQATSLISNLSQGCVPEHMTCYQSELIENLSNYAIHGEDFPQSQAARNFLETAPGPRTDLQRKAFDFLVTAGIFCPDEPIELRRVGASRHFPKAADAEANRIKLAPIIADPHRMDLTSTPTITIDEAKTKDHDDAISLQRTSITGNGPTDHYLIGIHIADASSLVPTEGAIDHEASQRMATLYVPDGAIPMLPQDFTLRLASLDTGQKRASLSLLIQISDSGEVISWKVCPSVIIVKESFTYDEAENSLQSQSSPWGNILYHLFQIAQSLRCSREAAGAINIDSPEIDIDINPSEQVDVVVRPRSSPARILISELMILYNSLLAGFCHKNGIPTAYRSQRPPTESSPVGMDINLTSKKQAAATLWRFNTIRHFQAASLSTRPAPHSGLGVSAYTQVTSPLRRYPDLVMQRQINHFLKSGRSFHTEKQMESLVYQAEIELKELAQIEESRNRYWFLKHLSQSLVSRLKTEEDSCLFSATILEIQPKRKALLELTEYPFRVRVKLSQTLKPGETTLLKLIEVDLWRRVPYFVHEPA